MNREELDRELDKWLDRATAEYGSTEVRPGLEVRVIANVNSRLARRRLSLRWLSLATATTAILVLSCYLFLTRFEDHPKVDSVTQEGQQFSLPPVAKLEHSPSIVQAQSTAKGHIKKRSPIAAGENAKTPFLSAGLSNEERCLLSFVKTASIQDLTGESGSGQLRMPNFELPTFQLPKAQVSSINIDMVLLPVAHQSEDPL
jgi:hypothetical protein